MMGMIRGLATDFILGLTATTQIQAESNNFAFVSSLGTPTMACQVGDQVVVAKLIKNEIVLEIRGFRISWLIREKQEDGLFTFVPLDPLIQGYPLGFALVSFDDRVMIFAPPEAGLQFKKDDLKLVQCK